MLIYLGLGSNRGNRRELLQEALTQIAERVGKVTSVSAFYETAPEGFVSEHPFLNAVCEVQTELLPEEILWYTERIEQKLGRLQKSQNLVYQDRTMDIDLLLVGNVMLQSDGLIVPHPRMHERLFVLEPLAEIAPDVIHPVMKKSIKQLLTELQHTK